MVQFKSLISTQHPSNWKVVRNKAFLSVTGEVVGKRANDFVLLSLTTNGVIVRDVESGKGKYPKDFDTYQVVRPNELVFCLFDIDETPRTVGLVEKEGMLTGAYTALKVNEKRAFPQFVYYYYLAVDNIKGLRPYYSGLRKTVRADKFLLIYIPLPPLSEQEQIVRYLEDKTSKIDAYVSEKEKEILLLQELKQKTIADAVTKGLNPDAKMKDSGISWIGEIPEHWEVKQLRSFLTLFTEKGHGDAQLLSVTREQGVIERDKDDKDENHNFVPDDLSGYKYIEKGDFAINKMKAWQGSYAVSNYDGIVSPAYFTCKLKGVNKDFFSKAIRSRAYVPFFTQYSKGIRVGQWDLNPNALKSIPFFLPPADEQRSIVSYIEEKCQKIDSLTTELQSEIDYLKEYKQRLIADCVTGQVNVQKEVT